MAEIIAGFLIGAFVVAAIIFSFGDSTQMYKDGQIDCLNHEIYYQLAEQEDGTTQWEYVPEGVEGN